MFGALPPVPSLSVLPGVESWQLPQKLSSPSTTAQLPSVLCDDPLVLQYCLAVAAPFAE
jgi:hypothetical protein